LRPQLKRDPLAGARKQAEVTMRSILSSIFLSLIAMNLPAPACAQAIVPGTWSGSVTDPSGNAKSVTYSVVRAHDSLSITLSQTSGGPPVSFADIRQVGDSLLFNLAAGRQGARLDCKLTRQPDGGYEGSCTDSGGQHGRMRMVPPAGK